LGRKISIMCTVQTGVMPYSLQGIEFGRIRGKIVNLDVFSVVGKPCPYAPVFVIRGIVLNQIYFLRKITSHDSFEIRTICFGIEDFLKMVEKTCTIQLDRTKNLERVSLPRSWYFHLTTYPRPRAIEGGVLPEARFVLEDDGRSLASCFFLMLGYLYRIQRDCTALSACASVFLGRWTDNPSS